MGPGVPEDLCWKTFFPCILRLSDVCTKSNTAVHAFKISSLVSVIYIIHTSKCVVICPIEMVVFVTKLQLTG